MYTVQQYANTLYEVLQDTHPKDHQKVIDNFIAILSENSQSELYPEIVKIVESLAKQKKDIKKVEITVARPLEVLEELELIKELNACLGGNIEFKKVVDQGLISGLVIKVDDVVIDGSVKKRIEKLRTQIIDN